PDVAAVMPVGNRSCESGVELFYYQYLSRQKFLDRQMQPFGQYGYRTPRYKAKKAAPDVCVDWRRGPHSCWSGVCRLAFEARSAVRGCLRGLARHREARQHDPPGAG